MINCDDIGNIWITRLSENAVVAATDDNSCHSSKMMSLPKGSPTKVTI